MSTYENLQLTIDLASPVASGHPWLMGDSILARLAIIDERGREWLRDCARERAGNGKSLAELGVELPLDETDGIYHASKSFFDVDEAYTETVYGRYDEATAHLVGGGRPRSKIPTTGGEFKSQVLVNGIRPATQCVFFLRGDRREVERLVGQHLSALGSDTAAGYGDIRDWSIDPIGEDRSLVHDGRAMRQLPVDRLQYTAETQTLAWTLPYHNADNLKRCAPPGAEVKLA
jgi:hypothetical protein